MTRSIALLGSTGSIGRQTLEVARELGLSVAALTANKSVDLIEQQAREFCPRLAVLYDEDAANELRARLSDTNTQVLSGMEGLLAAATADDADTVVTAVMGMIGLQPTLAAIEKKKRIALANKETLVCAGELVVAAAERCGAEIVPVDSEHSAIFQCLMGCGSRNEIRRLILTCSGGPFFGMTRAQLETVTKAAAPMIPFMTEDIYRNLVCHIDPSAPESVHLCDFPEVNESWIDAKLESDMDEVLKTGVMGRAARNTANIKNRQPIAKMFVKAEALPEYYQEIIEDELNVKAVEFTDDVRAFTSYTFKPQLKTVGPKYGKQLGNIRKALTELDGNAAMDTLNEKGALAFNFDGAEVVLTREDLLIDMAQTEGYVSEGDNTVTVVLDTNLTPELVEEGFYRELVSKIQTMRKEAGFEVMDKIVVYAHGNDKIQDVMKAHEDEIKSEVLADEMVLGETDGYVKEWNINKEAVTMGVKKL